MKKSLIALAVLAASGASMAQSSVTLYGLADVYFGQTSTGVGAAHLKQTAVNSGGLSSSRWGLKGSEDLGGGLKANFVLEQGYSIDDGTAGTHAGNLGNIAGAVKSSGAFSRETSVGLSGGFGKVDLGGRLGTAYDAIQGSTNNLWNSNMASGTNDTQKRGIVAYNSRFDNSIRYQSPSFGGVTAALQVGLGENKAANANATSLTSMNIMYAAGPLTVGYGYQQEKFQTLAAPVAPATVGLPNGVISTKYNLIGAAYDFGVAKLVGSYGTAKTATMKDKEFQFGVDMPVGSAARVGFGYSKTTGDTNGVTTTKASGFALAGTDSLSKRTDLYAAYSKDEADNNAGTDTQDNSKFGVGVRHKF